MAKQSVSICRWMKYTSVKVARITTSRVMITEGWARQVLADTTLGTGNKPPVQAPNRAACGMAVA